MPAQNDKTHDSVINLLAARASADPSLKQLMRTVASGSASKEQLATFQRHIDELTEMRAHQEQTTQRYAVVGFEEPGEEREGASKGGGVE